MTDLQRIQAALADPHNVTNPRAALNLLVKELRRVDAQQKAIEMAMKVLEKRLEKRK